MTDITELGSYGQNGLLLVTHHGNKHILDARAYFASYETGNGDYFNTPDINTQAEACLQVCKTLCQVFGECEPVMQVNQGGLLKPESLQVIGAQVHTQECALKNKVILQSNFLTRDGNKAHC